MPLGYLADKAHKAHPNAPPWQYRRIDWPCDWRGGGGGPRGAEALVGAGLMVQAGNWHRRSS